MEREPGKLTSTTIDRAGSGRVAANWSGDLPTIFSVLIFFFLRIKINRGRKKKKKKNFGSVEIESSFWGIESKIERRL